MMPKALRWLIGFISAVIVLGIFGITAALGMAAYLNAPPDKPPALSGDAMRYDENGGLILEVRGGETAQSVGSRLEAAGVIKNKNFWSILARFDKKHIKAGTYRIALPASQTAIRAILVAGETILIRVTIPEGVTLKKTAGILEEMGICGANEFLAASSSKEIIDAYGIPGATMEGYLFPDTYFFPPAYPASRVVSAMADNFYRRLLEIDSDISEMNAAEINRRVIMASIVEREYRIDEEASVMAGVFYNRLNIGMALQSCATVVYVITEIQGKPHPEVLYNRDIEIKDPYNTYQYPGLPPGPISAPGVTALRAAFFPAQTNYFYFRLVDANAGQHYFSRTLDDHIRAGVLYLKGM